MATVKALASFLNNYRHPFKTIFFLVLGSILLFTDCADRRNRFQPTSYFPIKTGHTWIFNGEIEKMVITDITKGAGDKIVTFSYYDSLDAVLWREKYNLIKNQIYLQSFEPATNVLPTISFQPALPFAPISKKLDYKTVLKSIETQIDSLMSTTEVDVEYVIEAIEDVVVPAGTFLNCIKMKINVLYPQTARRPFFVGEQYWWFAPNMGPVKYDLPSAYGELVKVDLNRNRVPQPIE